MKRLASGRAWRGPRQRHVRPGGAMPGVGRQPLSDAQPAKRRRMTTAAAATRTRTTAGRHGRAKMGPGKRGEIRRSGGKKYRWVLGVGPGGKRSDFWRRLHPRPAAAGGAAPPPRVEPHRAGVRAGHHPRRRQEEEAVPQAAALRQTRHVLIPGVGPAGEPASQSPTSC